MRQLALILVAACVAAVASAQRYAAAPAHYKVRDEATEDRRSHNAPRNYASYSPVAAAAEQQAEDQGFVHPIDFSGLLRDSILGAEAISSPAFGVGGSPLHLSQEPSSPFQSSGRLFPAFGAEQEKAATKEEKGFVEPNIHFRSFFDGSSPGGFQVKDFLAAHASSQKEVEDRVHAAAEGVDDYKYDGREVSEGGRRGGKQADRRGPEEGRRAAATEHRVYHDEDEVEEDEGGSEGGRVSKPNRGQYSGSGSHYRPQSYHYTGQQDDAGPQQFGPSQGPYSSAASSTKDAERSSEVPFYGPDYSKLIKEEEDAAEEGAGTAPKTTAKKGGKNCRRMSKKVTPADVGKGRFRRAARGKPAMTCYVCDDPANGGSYESCSYGSAPSDKSYFVSRSFSSKGKKNPEKQYRNRRYLPSAGLDEDKPGEDAYASGTNNEENKEEAPEYESSETSGLDSGKLAYEAVPGDSYDENFRRLFPEFNYREASASSPVTLSSSFPSTSGAEESEEEGEDVGKSAEATEEEKATDYTYKGPTQDFHLDQAQKKHLEKLVGEFSQKDRTACKKVMRDKMTCFQCVDEKGMQHEECMFVAKSDPKGRHLAYHELKEYRLVPEDGDTLLGGASEHSPLVLLFPHPLVKDSEAAYTSLVRTQRVPAPSFAASERRRNVEALGGGRKRRKGGDVNEGRRKSREEEEGGESEEEGEVVRAATAEEEAIADGVYADETVQTFDPIRKIHLPKYMLKKSDHESAFEEFVKSSHDSDD